MCSEHHAHVPLPPMQSTLLKALGGLLPISQGCELHTDVPTGFVFQNPDHQVVMPTVAADVAFGLGRCDAPLCGVVQVYTKIELCVLYII